ncbi:5'-3' exonuclease [Shewanella sp. ANA-3]|uniref:Flap endonuclease Xni n=1 Tax=Shewanella sp. (strain ANA-3) TaxID=94122 RepID=XNI_SHESA|nr:flap endonuclease Xni [Shewanella sp. ANA-3]A0KZ94.1 RecName: Full=Flap endonuclease Xni; Short=FEN [Shewanella sp. ANA-3]ABK49113.1 5'-3' exonuclease [Shewanella sp. ANA-3]
MNKFLIIDGLNLVRRIYAAIPDENDMDSLTERVSVACTKLLRIHHPTHVTIVWDGDEMSWRKQLYPDYKKGRKPMPEPLAAGLPALQEHLKSVQIQSIYAAAEADDVIATLAMKTAKAQGEAVIVSTDKGFSQLNHPRISQWDHFNQQYLNITELEQKLGVDRSQFLDLLALAGDSGNKIPGIAGIGPKSAAELLRTFRTLAALFSSLPNLGAKQAKKLAEGRDMARLSYKLAQLQIDLPLNINLKDFRVNGPATTPQLD